MRQIKTPSRGTSLHRKIRETILEVFFTLTTRVRYPVEVKLKAIEMRLAGIPVKEVIKELTSKM